MANLHSIYCDLLKQRLGATFVGWETTKNVYRLKALIPNQETLYFDIKGTPQDVTEKNYQDLLNKINNGRG